MSRLLEEIIVGKSSLVNGFIALAIIGAIVLGCTCNQKDGFKLGEKKDANTSETPKGDDPEDDKKDELSEDTVPSESFNQELVKTTLMNFNDAVQSADFSDFHKTISRSWRRNSRPSKFEKGFKQFIDKKINIGVIRSKQANFSPKPNIREKQRRQVLFLKGRYRTTPNPVRFDLEYIFEDGEWKLVFIGVDTKR